MNLEAYTAPASKPALWGGRILTVLVVLFLLLDGAVKVAMVDEVIKASAKYEIPERVVPGLGVVLIAAALIYAVPQTSILGAILLTGYLGGAVWTHVRQGDSIFSMVFPIIFGALIWGSLYLREPRLRALIPLRHQAPTVSHQHPVAETLHSAA